MLFVYFLLLCATSFGEIKIYIYRNIVDQQTENARERIKKCRESTIVHETLDRLPRLKLSLYQV
jgi:hypothetical protein